MINEYPGGLEHRKSGDFPDIETLRHQADALQPLDLNVDIGNIGAFAPVDKVEIGAITEHLGSGSGEGLQVNADLGGLGDGLRQLREREANAKLRHLLEQAQQKVAEEKFQSAILLIDQALSIEPASAPALLLKAYCHFALGDLDGSLELLAKAQEHATDSGTVILVLALRAACEREAMQRFEDELVELLESGQRDLALDQVEQRLRQRPTSATLLYARCVLLLSAGRLPAARAAAERALDVVSEANIRHFRELLQQIALRDSHETLESVRQHLRRGDGRRARAQLHTCSEAIEGDEHFETLRAYVDQRYAEGAGLGLVWWARKRQVKAQPLANKALQQLLCWLVQEELQEGVKALNDKQFEKAKRYFASAERIDGRSDVVAFLHAVALFKELQRAFERETPPSLDQADADLRQAARLAARASRDPVVGEQSRSLMTAIDANQRSLDSIRARVNKSRPISDCVNRFNMLIEHFEKNPIRSKAELIGARRMFQSLADDLHRLRGEHAPHSEEGQVLEKLAHSIQRIESQLAG